MLILALSNHDEGTKMLTLYICQYLDGDDPFAIICEPEDLQESVEDAVSNMYGAIVDRWSYERNNLWAYCYDSIDGWFVVIAVPQIIIYGVSDALVTK